MSYAKPTGAYVGKKLGPLPPDAKKLAAYAVAWLKPHVEYGSPDELWRAVHELIDALAGRRGSTHYVRHLPLTDWRRCEVVLSRDGDLPIKGTEVPLRNLFYSLERDENVAQFLTENPAVSRAQVSCILSHLTDSLGS